MREENSSTLVQFTTLLAVDSVAVLEINILTRFFFFKEVMANKIGFLKEKAMRASSLFLY